MNHRAKRIIIRKIARIKAIGVTKMRENFIEISFQAKFLRKARNFVEIHLHYFCTILYLQGAFVCNLWCHPGSWLCPSHPEVNFKASKNPTEPSKNACIHRQMCRTVQELALLWWPILLPGNSWIHSPAKQLCHLPCKGRTRCSWLPCQTEGNLSSSLQESHTIKHKRSL